MKVLNIGSMNLDHVYNVDHIILPGETQATTGLNLFLGGKGMNQSIALAKAGVEVYHGGMFGKDGYAFIVPAKNTAFIMITFVKQRAIPGIPLSRLTKMPRTVFFFLQEQMIC